MFSAGGQLVYPGGKNYLSLWTELLYNKNIDCVDGQTSQVKIVLTAAQFAWYPAFMKPLHVAPM